LCEREFVIGAWVMVVGVAPRKRRKHCPFHWNKNVIICLEKLEEFFILSYLIIPCAQLSEPLFLFLSLALFMSQFSISLGGNSLIAHLSTFKACD
jgi:hypothetical protein